MIGQSELGFGGAGAGWAGHGDVFEGALADACGGLQTIQPLMGSPRKPRGRTHPVDDRAANSEIRVATEWDATRIVEATRCIPQPFAPEAEQFFKVARSAERAQDLSRNDIHQPEG